MQAQQKSAHITHAVIGNQETIDFGISTDPAFFQILSSTLYKNPVLAVVREILCNAWDAHIDSQQTDKPIQITLKDDEFIIRDFGKGIPHDQIGPVYGVYGASTKKTDKRQTGSFGLGCKSPFAVVEHFEVTSWNQGVKSVYVVSKSSASTTGTPGITRLLSVPTDQSGLQVKIRIHSDDAQRFMHYIQNIVFLGDIKATLNDQLLETVNLSSAPNSWTLVHINRLLNDRHGNNRIYVRYGTVIYPLEEIAQYSDNYRAIKSFVSNSTSDQILLIQAEPDSLAVMPNRESLSMQDQTIESLRLICEHFFKFVLATRYQTELFNAAKRKINEAQRFMDLLNLNQITATQPQYYADGPVKLSSTQDVLYSIAERNVNRKYATNSDGWFNKKVNQYRFTTMLSMPNVDRGLIQTYGKMHLSLNTKKTRDIKNPRSAWYCRRVLKPILKALSNHKVNIKSSLLLLGELPYGYRRRSSSQRTSFHPINDVLRNTAQQVDMSGALVKTIFLSSSISLLEQNYNAYLTQFSYPVKAGILAYILPTSKSLWPTITDIFTKLGYYIVDLTENYDWMPYPKADPIPRVKAPIIPGKRTLLSYYNADRRLNKQLEEADISKRIKTFEYYALIKRNRDENVPDTIYDMPSLPYRLVKHIAELGIGIETANTANALRKQGVSCMAEYVIRNITTHIMNSATIVETMNYDINGYSKYNPGLTESLLKFLNKHNAMSQHYGLKNTLTDDDRYALDWFDYFKKGYIQSFDRIQYVDGVKRTLLEDTDKYLKSIKLDPVVEKAHKQIKDNPGLKFLDFELMYHVLFPRNNDPVDPVAAVTVHAILKAAM